MFLSEPTPAVETLHHYLTSLPILVSQTSCYICLFTMQCKLCTFNTAKALWRLTWSLKQLRHFTHACIHAGRERGLRIVDVTGSDSGAIIEAARGCGRWGSSGSKSRSPGSWFVLHVKVSQMQTLQRKHRVSSLRQGVPRFFFYVFYRQLSSQAILLVSLTQPSPFVLKFTQMCIP